MEPVQEHRSWVSSRFVAWFIHFDEHKLRPFLIRKYNIGNIVLADQLDDAMKRKIDDEDDLNAPEYDEGDYGEAPEKAKKSVSNQAFVGAGNNDRLIKQLLGDNHNFKLL